MFRSFPRKRESRAKPTSPSMSLWIPAFAGMSGVEFDSITPKHVLVRLNAGLGDDAVPLGCLGDDELLQFLRTGRDRLGALLDEAGAHRGIVHGLLQRLVELVDHGFRRNCRSSSSPRQPS